MNYRKTVLLALGVVSAGLAPQLARAGWDCTAPGLELRYLEGSGILTVTEGTALTVYTQVEYLGSDTGDIDFIFGSKEHGGLWFHQDDAHPSVLKLGKKKHGKWKRVLELDCQSAYP